MDEANPPLDVTMPEPNRSDFRSPEPEVMPLERPSKRGFTAEYKLLILQELDACTERGQIGAILRREGLYRSHITAWRTQFEGGGLQALAAQQRGPKPDIHAAEVARLERENRKLQEELRKARLVIDLQKKPRSCWVFR
jgi:transposase-like protein